MIERSKQEIEKLVQASNLYAPISEDEFEDAIDLLAQFLLFGTKWESVILKNPKARRKVPIIQDIPMICKGADCEYAAKCPVLKNIKQDADRLKLIGTECRAEKLYATEQFAVIIKDLQIDPEQSIDIIDAASLVRLLVLKRRVDWDIAIKGMMDKEPGVVDPRTSQVYFKNVVHPLLKVAESLEKQIQALQKQLMASRQARAALAASLGRGSADMLKNLFSGDIQALEADFPIDAEFEEE